MCSCQSNSKLRCNVDAFRVDQKPKICWIILFQVFARAFRRCCRVRGARCNGRYLLFIRSQTCSLSLRSRPRSRHGFRINGIRFVIILDCFPAIHIPKYVFCAEYREKIQPLSRYTRCTCFSSFGWKRCSTCTSADQNTLSR